MPNMAIGYTGMEGADYTNLVTTGKIDTQDRTHYAYGFEDNLESGVRWFGHSGGAPGINSTLRIYLRSGYIIAVMGNFDPPAADRIAGFIGARLPAE
jgi:Beta-lactamase